MAKKKKKSQQSETTTDSNGTSSSANPPPANGTFKKSANEPSTSALIICRNKHWRYISSFHGPWLQLPPEMLETMAHSNYLNPRPHLVDAAVFYEVLKIRKAVEEATNLAVRATSGLTSAALNSSLNAGNGLLGGAAALGLGYGGNGGNAKLSRERKHRMRELATAKLSQAYHLDEIAASVATMQSASTLEDVAQIVLQRSPSDIDAKYVHFFHEKIPSRMMAECTPLDTLNDIIAERPHDGAPWRTRALTRIHKKDFENSAKDLSEGLALARTANSQHRVGRDQMVLAKSMKEKYGRDWKEQVKIPEEDQPNSLEPQLLFHRAGVYFTIACQHIDRALDGLKEALEAKQRRDLQTAAGDEPTPRTPEEQEADRQRVEARKQVRANAKRALRDYLAFISHFDYTPGIPPEIVEECIRQAGGASNGYQNGNGTESNAVHRLLDSPANLSSPTTEAIVPHRKAHSHYGDRSSWPTLPPLEIFRSNQLFDAIPPASLPPYPRPIPTNPSLSTPSAAAFAFGEMHERVTYHPLLTDALHSLLLCHALIQTAPKEHLRHAHNVARLARLCDGYPIFLPARSPARADWIEVLRRTGNWIGLTMSWESLSRALSFNRPGKPGAPNAFSTNGDSTSTRQETDEQRRERQKHEAILEALADERVVDEESFQRAVRARELRYREDEAMDSQTNANSTSTASSEDIPDTIPTPSPRVSSPASTPIPTPRRWAQDEGREYPISTERAEAISRWVREAPLTVDTGGSSSAKRTRRKGKGKPTKASSSQPLKEESTGLEASVETLDVREEEDVD